MAALRQTVAYDSRGMGLSDRDPADFSVEARVRDLAAVIDDLNVPEVALLGSHFGGLAAILYASTHRERVSHLILNAAFSDGPAYHAATRDVRALVAMASMAVDEWDFYTLTAARTVLGPDGADRAEALASVMRSAMTPEAFVRFRQETATANVSDHLGSIAAPTLVLHDSTWPMSSLGACQQLAACIRSARLVVVAGEPAAFSAIAESLGAEIPEPGSLQRTEANRSSLRTVLFTDLVGHTEMMSRLGDELGREVLREHERITREVLKASGGTEIKTMGDGFMASFGSVTRAVECAIALQRAFAKHEGQPLSVRVGLNAGEPIAEDGDLFGATVILASRIAAKAGGGEILVADTVRGLCSGKGFLFADRGEFVAKGFEEPVRVYEVRWRE
jgi:class 3 adenylate cyclase